MPDPSLFRHYQIVQDSGGNNVELVRNPNQVAVLAFDTRRLEFVHCHVLLDGVPDRSGFEEKCRKLQHTGHPLLARVVEYGEDDGNTFYITSHVDGETLASYLERQQELPGWLALLVAVRSVEAATALLSATGEVPENALQALRIVQTGQQQVQIMAADYPVALPADSRKAAKPAIEQPVRQLRQFFQGPTEDEPHLPDQMLPGAEFSALLEACLAAVTTSSLKALADLRTALQKLLPDLHGGEIPTAHKPRALLAPLLATYQEVARGVVNAVRIQSQRLDMANPYSMRGVLTKSGRTVMVEQVPAGRLAGSVVKATDQKLLDLATQREFSSLVPVALLLETTEVTCMAEEWVEGVSLAELLRERLSLNVHEAYLVLAALDSALDALEKSGADTRKLRLEDLILLTGSPREDTRTARLLLTKLNEWPAFSLMLRAHPSLSAMSGRGLDPACILPPAKGTGGAPGWNGGWLAALGRFLTGIEQIPGLPKEPPGGPREKESVARLFDEEILLYATGKDSRRADFLSRYVRILQHHNLVNADTRAAAPAPELPVEEAPAPRPTLKASTSALRKVSDPSAPPPSRTAAEAAAPMALTSGMAADTTKPTIGFAELLFRDTSVVEKGDAHDWARTAADAPPTIQPGEVLLPPNEFVPLWLRAAVFIGGSIVAGAILAHVSGQALWLKPKPAPGPQVPAPAAATNSPLRPAQAKTSPEPPPGPAAPAIKPPELPPEQAASTGSDLLKPPASTLKDDL